MTFLSTVWRMACPLEILKATAHQNCKFWFKVCQTYPIMETQNFSLNYIHIEFVSDNSPNVYYWIFLLLAKGLLVNMILLQALEFHLWACQVYSLTPIHTLGKKIQWQIYLTIFLQKYAVALQIWWHFMLFILLDFSFTKLGLLENLPHFLWHLYEYDFISADAIFSMEEHWNQWLGTYIGTVGQ